MNTIYYDNLNEYDRYMLCLEKTFDAVMCEAELALEMVENRLAINCMKAEARVIQESGTEEDLLYLYTEAEAEAAPAKQGIFSTIFNGIINFISNAWNGFINLFKKQNKEEMVAANKGKSITLEYNVEGLRSSLNEISSSIDSSSKGKTVAKLAALIAVIATAGGVGAYTIRRSSAKKATEVTPENLDSVTKESKSLFTSVLDILKKLRDLFGKSSNENTEGSDGEDKKKDNAVINFFKGFSKLIVKETNKITAFFGRSKESFKQGVQNVADTAKNTVDEVKDTAKNAIDKAKTEAKIAGAVAADKIDELKDKVEETKTRVEKKFTQGGSVMDKIKDKLEKEKQDRELRLKVKTESSEDDDDMTDLDMAMMESASLEELEALINSL